MTTETFVKDIKPGLKNLNLIFIVLETGGYCWGGGPPARVLEVGGQKEGTPTPFLTCSVGGRVHPETWLTPNHFPSRPQPLKLQ